MGDYLFTDTKFIEQLSTEYRDVFDKLWDEVKYLCKVATAGSKEGRQLEKVKKVFEDAYRAEGAKNPTGDGGTKYSISEVVDENGKSYGIGVHLDSTLLEGLTPDERVEMVKEYVKELGGEAFTAYDPNGIAVDITIAESNARFKNHNGKKVQVNKDLTTKRIGKGVKQEAIVLIDELVATSKPSGSKASQYSHGWLDNNGQNNWEYWKTYIQDKGGTIYEAILNIANAADGRKILYDISPIRKQGSPSTSGTIPADTKISQDGTDVKGQASLSSDGDLAPTADWLNTYGKDIALEAPVRDDLDTANASESDTKQTEAVTEATRRDLDRLKNLQRSTLEDFDRRIEKAQGKYDAMKNKGGKAAQRALGKIEKLQKQRAAGAGPYFSEN